MSKNKGSAFVIVLVALALIGSGVALSVVAPPTSFEPMSDSASRLPGASFFSFWDKSPTTKVQKQETNTQVLADIERQLGFAQKSGGISPTNYKDIDKKLKALEVKKIDTKKARALLAKLSVGGQGSKTAPSKAKTGSGTQTLADVEQELFRMSSYAGISPQIYAELEAKLKVFEAKGANTKNARALLKKLKVGGQEKKSQPPLNLPLGTGGDGGKTKGGLVRWDYRYGKWEPSRTPPSCGPMVLESPADMSKADSILYPGQVRGSSIKDYKAHGGIHFKPGDIEVRVPLDGYVFSGVRFYYQGHIQYGIDIMTECGIMQRFGHLYELSPKFQTIAETFRKPVEGDSRGTFLEPPIPVKKGEVIATKIGWPGGPNGFDWGVYDLRKENEVAKDGTFRKAHEFQWWYDYYGLCWLDYLSENDQALAKALPGGDGKMGKTSDYCGR